MKALIVSRHQAYIEKLSLRLAFCHFDVQLASSHEYAVQFIFENPSCLVFADLLSVELEPHLLDFQQDPSLIVDSVNHSNTTVPINAIQILRSVEGRIPYAFVVGLIESSEPEHMLNTIRQGLVDCLCLNSPDQEPLIDQVIYRVKNRLSVLLNSQHEINNAHKDGELNELYELRQDQEAACSVQLKILPPSPMRFGELEFSYRIFPSLYLSGDCIYFYAFNEQFSFFYFADVSGHGSASAFITVLLKSITLRWVNDYNEELTEAPSPSLYLSYVNAELLQMKLGKHVALFCGVINHQNNTLCYSSAAQFPKPYYKDNNGVHTIEEVGLPIGLFPEPSYSEKSLLISSDFELYLFSDGVLELMEEPSIAEKEASILRILSSKQNKSTNTNIMYIDDLCQSVGIDSNLNLKDDVSLLMIKYCP